MEKVVGNIRKNSIKNLLLSLLFGIVPNFATFMIIYFSITEGFETVYLIGILFGIMAYMIDKRIIELIGLISNPLRSDIFKKYGSPEQVKEIIDEIENSKEYEDKHLVISKNYISDKKDYEKIVACDDVLGAHKLIHKTNYVVDYIQIVIIDKYAHQSAYTYKPKEEEKCNQLLYLISQKCENAEVGYTKREADNIKNKKIQLPKTEIKKPKEYEYQCPDCGFKLDKESKFCKNCGCKIDWE